MSLSAAENESSAGSEIHIPADINWEMLDKSKFFFLGAVLFSGVSAALYPMVVLKTRQQVLVKEIPCFQLAASIMRSEGLRGFYRGLGTSLMGTVPARALYMGALELTKSSMVAATVKLGCTDATAAAIASATAGLSSAMAAQLVWTPIDVVSQRLMVQGGNNYSNYSRYCGGIDALRKIIYKDGVKGLYRGFAISIFTYAPSNAMWWGSYSIAYRVISESAGFGLDTKAVIGVQGVSAAMASGVSALVTMPLDTIKTRLQVMEQVDDCQPHGNDINTINKLRRGRGPSIRMILRKLVKEEGLSACYRGLWPRWLSMSFSATTMITSYEFLKRLSTKNNEDITN